MANPVQSLNENFFYNSMLARALIQLLPVRDRTLIRIWLEKLHQMDANAQEMAIRNDYMWFMLVMLQSKRITVPFKNGPPEELQPLKNILPPMIYEEVLTATDQNMSWLDHAEAGDVAEEKQDVVRGLPSEFLNNQPVPQNGIICYLAAFSDQDY